MHLTPLDYFKFHSQRPITSMTSAMNKGETFLISSEHTSQLNVSIHKFPDKFGPDDIGKNK